MRKQISGDIVTLSRHVKVMCPKCRKPWTIVVYYRYSNKHKNQRLAELRTEKMVNKRAQAIKKHSHLCDECGV